ncbi:hypothetical protein NDN08_004898 [Rhodosorus marinus]|uniref:Uncharacterized protein n=1 Tax=Rhodosorus marinus TaxID=101924 RepID=A0AAV8UHX0_9RHOD|nr:hypothetical protein NDN08_004898 [Rhodosorus marinus]
MKLASMGSLRSFRLRGSSLNVNDNDKLTKKDSKKGNAMNSVLEDKDNWLSSMDVLGHSEDLGSVMDSNVQLFDDL